MTAEHFWYGNPQDFFVYAKVYERKLKMEAQKESNFAWSIGLYTYLAVSQSMSDALSGKKKKIFPMKPPNLLKQEETPEKAAKREEIRRKIEEHNAKIAMIIQAGNQNKQIVS